MDGTGDQHVGQLLRQHRTRRQVTQQELACLSRVSVRTIRDIELGGCQQPRRETVRLVADGLGLTGRERAEFEAAAGRAATAHELGVLFRSEPVRPPAPIDALVGRRAEVCTLAGLLATGHQRLVTIVGLSGVGKTRLALEVAGVLHGSRGFPVLWTSADAPDPTADATHGSDQLARLIRAQLGTLFAVPDPVPDPDRMTDRMRGRVPERASDHAPDRPPDRAPDRAPDELRTLIADRPALLVLDGVVPSRVRTDRILGLLRDCPGLRVLVTSRAELAVRDERAFPLTPLPLPRSATDDLDRITLVPSIQLLITYIRHFRPEFRLTAANSGAVVRLSQCLDGIPTALEAAAPLFMLYEPEVVRDCVEAEPFEVLATPAAGTGTPGIREWLCQAVDALDPAERLLLGELAMLDAGWSVAEAGASTGLRTAVCARLVQRLLAHGMVRPDAGAERARFRVLNLVRSLYRTLGGPQPRAADRRSAPAAGPSGRADRHADADTCAVRPVGWAPLPALVASAPPLPG